MGGGVVKGTGSVQEAGGKRTQSRVPKVAELGETLFLIVSLSPTVPCMAVTLISWIPVGQFLMRDSQIWTTSSLTAQQVSNFDNKQMIKLYNGC